MPVKVIYYVNNLLTADSKEFYKRRNISLRVLLKASILVLKRNNTLKPGIKKRAKRYELIRKAIISYFN